VAARPHPWTVWRCGCIQEEDAADDDSVLKRTIILLVVTNRIAFEDQLRHAGLVLWSLDDYSMDMPSAKKPPRETLKPVAKLKRWHVSLLRQRALPLGVVEAPDEKAAEAAAVKKFGLDDEQRMRLAVRAEQ
jgi:hypothetical protein